MSLVPVADDPQEIEVTLGGERKALLDLPADPFEVTGEDVRKIGGYSENFKRKVTRDIKKVAQSVDGKVGSKHVDTQELTGYTLFDVIQPPYNLDYLSQLFELSPPHKAAVQAKVANIVGLGFDFVDSSKTQRKLDDATSADDKAKITKKITRAKEDVREWLDSCNEEADFLETLSRVWTDYEVTGNGYLEIGRRSNGEIGYIGHIPATSLRIRKQRDGFVQIVSNKMVFFRNFGSDTADPFGNDRRPNEIIHFKKYTPTNSFYGVPDIIAARQSIAGNEFAGRFNLDYFENKAVPRYVIIVKGANLSARSQQQLVEFFDTGLKGKHHRTIYVPLPADQQDNKVSFEMKPVEAGTQDASFVNYNKINLQNILMAHRVPVTKVSVGEGVPLAAARDADKTFKEQVCRPEQKVAEKKLNKIIKERTDIFLLKLNELSLTDEDTQSKIDERDVRNNIVLPNEIRRRRGMPAIPDGDKTLSQKQMEQAKATKTDPSAQQRADANATANQTRTRDANRSAGATDTAGEGRNAKGDGRAAA